MRFYEDDFFTEDDLSDIDVVELHDAHYSERDFIRLQQELNKAPR